MPQARASPPPPAASLGAWHAVRAWAHAGGESQETIEDPHGVIGACVTLRLNGRLVGAGTVLDDEPGAVHRAAHLAVVASASRLPSLVPAGVSLKEARRRLTVDVQLAHTLTPVFGDTVPAAVADLSPGLDGCAARVGSTVHAVFPATALSQNTTPSSAMTQAISKHALPLDLQPMALKRHRASHGLSLLSFRASHIAQPGASDAPRFLHRGAVPHQLGAVAPTELGAWAELIAGHLSGRIVRNPATEPVGLRSVYRPWSDTYAKPRLGSPEETALACYALLRSGFAADTAGSGAVHALVDRIASQNPSITTTAFSVLAQHPPCSCPRRSPQAAEQIKALRAAAHPSSGHTASELAVVAYALATATSAPEHDAALWSDAESLTRRLFRETDASQLPSLLPWLGWAAHRLHETVANTGVNTGVKTVASLPQALALRRVRDLCWAHQIRPSTPWADTAASEPDLMGSLVFTSARRPSPSWHTARPVAYLATMLGDERLTSDPELPSEVLRLTHALRFLRQLTADQTLSWMYPDPRLAHGGVRSSLWEHSQPLSASAMTLLAITEARRAIAGRTTNAQPGADGPG